MAEIKVLAEGPYIVDANDGLLIIDRDGRATPVTNRPVALCRCGATGTEPFCDGTHKTIEFQRRPR